MGLVFPSDEKQALRLRRTLLALAGAAIHTFICWLCFKFGFFRGSFEDFLVFFGLAWAGNLFFFLMIRSGLNLFFPDPSLTLVQISWATVVVMVSAFYIDELRMVLLMLYLLVMFFGAFRLRTSGFIFVAALAVFGYGTVVLLIAKSEFRIVDFRVEFIQWLGFAVVMTAFAFVGSELSSLRRTSSRQNKKLKEALGRIEELAITDELTGIYNRRHILEVLKYKKNLADRDGRPFVVCFLDLDHFKRINDRFGHNVGDLVLQKFSELITAAVRNVDYVARFGGEEFLMVLVDVGLEEALPVAERVRAKVERLSFGDIAPDLGLTVSIGATVYVLQERIEDALTRADQALYEAKQTGRNRIVTAQTPEAGRPEAREAC